MLILIVIGLMLTGTLPIISVSAAPIDIMVSPDTGQVGSTITVSGENASSNGEVRVYLMGFIFMAATTANETGGYSVNVTVPAVPTGLYDITVLDVTTEDTSSASFTIQPKIVLSLAEGAFNDTVTVEGSGFQSVSPITLMFSETDVTPSPPPSTDWLGSFRTGFHVPEMPNGTYPVMADDGTSNASDLFTVIPKILLAPQTSGPPSTLLFVIGTGFAPSVNVTIEFDGIDVTYPIGIATSSNGSFGGMGLPTMFFVPDVADGTHIVNATDETGTSATAPFTVPSPVMTLTPNITSGHSIVTATGSGFPPNMPILLYLEDIFLVDLIDLMAQGPAIFADEHGSYELSFIVSVAKPGVYKVVAYRPGEAVADELTIGEEVASASLTIVENALLVDIQNEIITILIPDLGLVKANLTEINGRLVSVQGTVATIETDLGTIEADVNDIQAEVVPTGYEFNLLATILALVAAIGAWFSAILIRKKPQLPPSKSKKK